MHDLTQCKDHRRLMQVLERLIVALRHSDPSTWPTFDRWIRRVAEEASVNMEYDNVTAEEAIAPFTFFVREEAKRAPGKEADALQIIQAIVDDEAAYVSPAVDDEGNEIWVDERLDQ